MNASTYTRYFREGEAGQASTPCCSCHLLVAQTTHTETPGTWLASVDAALAPREGGEYVEVESRKPVTIAE